MLSNFNQTWNRSMPTHFSEIPHISAHQFSACYMQTHEPTDRRHKVSMQLSTVNTPKKEMKKKCETKEKSWQH
jgi:hypothetical protein